eukprot:16431-Heterococcus_DN1.PRE.5
MYHKVQYSLIFVRCGKCCAQCIVLHCTRGIADMPLQCNTPVSVSHKSLHLVANELSAASRACTVSKDSSSRISLVYLMAVIHSASSSCQTVPISVAVRALAVQ